MTSPCPSRSTTPVNCRAADALCDDDWDRFLQGTELGQFQQSSLWAQYKHHEGWQPERVILSDDGGPLAGFQLLWRRSRLGRIGYISKGPAARDAASAPWDELARQIQSTANRLKLQAVIVQSPDWAPEAVPVLRRHGFLDNHLYDVIKATLLIDLSAGWHAVEAGFRKGARRAIDRAKLHGYKVRDGDRQDLPRFFAAMRAMCVRIGTRPNPGSERSLSAFWDSFMQGGVVRLLLACKGSEALGGLLLLRFGGRMTAWKQGCDPDEVGFRPDTLLIGEAIRTGAESGCRWFDFVSFYPETARAADVAGRAPNERSASRSFFHVGFGAKPLDLPDPLIWFRKPMVRRVYRFASRLPAFAQVNRVIR